MFGVCTFIKNQKNGQTAVFEGHQYSKHKVSKTKLHWRCTQYYKNRCPGKITTVEDNVVAKSDHSHAGDAREKEKRIAFSELMEKSKNSNSPPRRVIRSITATVSTPAAIAMPKYETMARNVRRWRQNGNTSPAIPDTLLELIITGEYSQTINGEAFVLFDNKDEVNRIIIFATRDNLKFLAICDDLYMDGTFSITPPLFKQVYTIHGRRMKRHFPLVYVLACKKDTSIYETIFRQLKLAEPTLDPKLIMVDFEQAAIAAASNVFPSADDDSNFASNMRCIAALAFVPVTDVVRRFAELKEFDFFKQKLKGTTAIDVGVQKLFAYMETNWIGCKPRRAYRPGVFSLDLWNVYELTLELFPRTNNAVEGWHNAIAALFGIHPNIFKFIHGIKLEQKATEVLTRQMFAGEDVSPATTNHNLVIQEKILIVVKTYGDVKNDYLFQNYLLGLAHSIHFSTN